MVDCREVKYRNEYYTEGNAEIHISYLDDKIESLSVRHLSRDGLATSSALFHPDDFVSLCAIVDEIRGRNDIVAQ